MAGGCLGMTAALSERPLWIFDLDGTLTRPQHDFAAIRRALGVPADADILAWIAARPAPERQQLDQALDRIELEHAGRSEIAPGAEALLGWLVERGTRLGVLTRNSSESAEIALAGIGLRPQIDWLMAREQTVPKPAPDGIRQLLRLAGVTCAQAVMVGDDLNDLLAGRAAGVVTVHVDHRGTFAWSRWADYEVATLTELLDSLQRDNRF